MVEVVNWGLRPKYIYIMHRLKDHYPRLFDDRYDRRIFQGSSKEGETLTFEGPSQRRIIASQETSLIKWAQKEGLPVLVRSDKQRDSLIVALPITEEHFLLYRRNDKDGMARRREQTAREWTELANSHGVRVRFFANLASCLSYYVNSLESPGPGYALRIGGYPANHSWPDKLIAALSRIDFTVMRRALQQVYEASADRSLPMRYVDIYKSRGDCVMFALTDKNPEK